MSSYVGMQPWERVCGNELCGVVVWSWHLHREPSDLITAASSFQNANSTRIAYRHTPAKSIYEIIAIHSWHIAGTSKLVEVAQRPQWPQAAVRRGGRPSLLCGLFLVVPSQNPCHVEPCGFPPWFLWLKSLEYLESKPQTGRHEENDSAKALVVSSAFLWRWLTESRRNGQGSEVQFDTNCDMATFSNN